MVINIIDLINAKEQIVIKSIKDVFEGEDMQTNSVLQATVLIFIFISTSLQQKLMNQDMLTEIMVMKLKDEKQLKKNLTACLLELTSMKKILTLSKK